MKRRAFYLLAAILSLLFSPLFSEEPVAPLPVAPLIEKKEPMAPTPFFFTSFEEAKKEAFAHDKAIILVFEGSDWCPWCVKLDKEILAQKEFQLPVSKKAVCVKVDFPRRTPLPDAIKIQNRALKERYKVHYFATIILLNKSLEVIEQMGYEPMTPAQYASKVLASIEAHQG